MNVEQNRIPIYLKVENGLANRLRSLSSFAKFAEKNNRILYLCWTKGAGFSEEKFEDLFQSWPKFLKLISIDDYNLASKIYFNLHKAIFKDEIHPEKYVTAFDTEFILNKIQNNEFCYEGNSCLEYMFPSNFSDYYCDIEFLSDFLINYKLNNKIYETTKNFDDNTIGVHIRRGDALESPWKRYYCVSTINTFKQLMDKELSANPETNFFLSTDCEETSKYFQEKYLGKIIVQEKDFFKSLDEKAEKPLQKEALIDLVCLSKTKRMIGSYWSSFSDCASRMGKINIKTAIHSCDNNVSLIVAVKNRTNALKISLQSWLRFSEIAEIIIVDWSSDEDIEYLEEIDKRIKVITVKGKQNFNLPAAYNFAAKYATKDFLLKMDADYILSPYYSFFNSYNLPPACFLTGHYTDSKKDNSCGFLSYLNGMIFLRTSDFFSVNGYSEDFVGYGYDDCDLYHRLEEKGLTRVFLDHQNIDVFHTPHSDAERIKHYENKNLNETLTENLAKSYSRIPTTSIKNRSVVICYPKYFNTHNKDSNYFIKITGNNTGNIVNQHSVWSFIKNKKTTAKDLEYNADQINKEGNVLVVPSSSFLSNNFNAKDFVLFLRKIKLPILFLGLGIGSKSYNVPQQLSQEALEIIDIIKENKFPIGVRGQKTKKLLNDYSINENVFEIGTPSNFINMDPELYEKLQNKFNLNSNKIIFNQDEIWSGDFSKRRIEQNLFKLFLNSSGFLTQQSSIINELRSNNSYEVNKKSLDPIRKTIAPQLSESEFEKIINQSMRLYINVEQWLEDASRMDLSLGLRFQANMVAHQSGCPAIWVYHDARTQEMTELMELPRISLEEAELCNSIEDFKSKCILNYKNYHEKRQVLLSNFKNLCEKYDVQLDL